MEPGQARSSSGVTANGSANVVDGGGNPGKIPGSSLLQEDGGQGALFGPNWPRRRAAPRFYEPMESRQRSLRLLGATTTVAFKAIREVLAVADERFPFIGTIYVTEHWQTGLMTAAAARGW